jgi:hypothetical protein
MTTSPDHVDSREDLAAFVRSLRRSNAEDGGSWENANLPSFLDALAAWMDDADGWYRNTPAGSCRLAVTGRSSRELCKQRQRTSSPSRVECVSKSRR